MKVYKSEVDIWLALLVIVPVFIAVIAALQSSEWIAAGGLLLCIIFILYLFYTTKYTINKDVLTVKSGFIVNIFIPVSAIKSIKKTNNPLSAPALSLNRLEIKYGNKYDYTLISPVNREDFIKQLLAINPDIKVEV